MHVPRNTPPKQPRSVNRSWAFCQHMGAASSRAGGRSYAAVEKAAGSAAAKPGLEAAPSRVALDAARAEDQRYKRQNPTLAEEEQLEAQDEGLGTLLDQLGGSIRGTQVDILPKQVLSQGRATTSAAAGADDSSRRLPPVAMAQLFELQAEAAGRRPDVAHLIRRYDVDQQLIDRVLSTCCRPTIVEASGSKGVSAFAQWPEWFKQRQ